MTSGPPVSVIRMAFIATPLSSNRLSLPPPSSVAASLLLPPAAIADNGPRDLEPRPGRRLAGRAPRRVHLVHGHGRDPDAARGLGPPRHAGRLAHHRRPGRLHRRHLPLCRPERG